MTEAHDQDAKVENEVVMLKQQLQAERAFTRLYLDQTENIVVFINANECIHIVNRRTNNLFGYSREELLGKNWFDLAVEEDVRETERQKFRNVMNGGRQLFKQYSENKVKTTRGLRDIRWAIRVHLSPTSNKPIGQMMIGEDVTEQKKDKEKIDYMAYHDQLTGLNNRSFLVENLSRIVEEAQRQSWASSLLFMDFDNFKACNDTYGHAAGDELLRQISSRLKRISRPADVVARLGGDEFVIVLPDISKSLPEARSQSTIVAKRIRDAFQKPFELKVTIDGDEENLVSHLSRASIGIALFPFDASTPDEMLSFADEAMYASKNGGRNRYTFYADLPANSKTPQLMAAN